MNATAQAELRRSAEALAAPLPDLLADAEHLARAVTFGAHGRRRAGAGDEFWQFRPAMAGDTARMIDWRRSARSDSHFVREKEWQASQSVLVWVDAAQSLRFSSGPGHPAKAERARLLAMAACILLVRGGERIALAALGTPPRASRTELLRVARALVAEPDDEEYGAPEFRVMPPHSRALLVSDFLGPIDRLEAQVARAADRDVRGVLLQVLDPSEEGFPFDGRSIFESVGGTVRHETLKAGELRERYLARLAERKARLAELARGAGWQYSCHRTSESAQSALLWVYAALERRA